MTNVRHNAGLSLVEMLVVVGIVALLASLVLVITLRVENQSKERATANIFALLRTALQEYYEDTGRFPLQGEKNHNMAAAHVGLLYGALNSVPASRQILKRVDSAFVIVDASTVTRIRDPWGTVLDYVYVSGAQFPELISAGADKKFGTADDISSKGM